MPFNGGAYFFTAGKSRRRGVELGLDWTPIAALTLGGALTLSNNEYVDYVNDLGDFGGNEVAGLPPVFFDGEARWRPAPGFSIAGNVRARRPLLRRRREHGTREGLRAHRRGDRVFASDVRSASCARSSPETTWRTRTHVASVFINGISGQFYEAGLPRSVSAGLSIALR